MFKSPSTGTPSDAVAYSDFMGQVKTNQIEEVLIDGRNLRGKTGTGRTVTTVMPPSTDVVKVLDENDVRIVATPEDRACPVSFPFCYPGFQCCYSSGFGSFLCGKCREDPRCDGIWQVEGKVAD